MTEIKTVKTAQAELGKAIAHVEQSLELLEWQSNTKDVGWELDVMNTYSQEHKTHEAVLPDGAKVRVTFTGPAIEKSTGEVRPGFDREVLSFKYESAKGSTDLPVISFYAVEAAPHSLEERVSAIHSTIFSQDEVSLDTSVHG